MLARKLRYGVRPARFADGADRRHVRLVHVERVLAEDLARREVDEALERLLCSECRLEHVVRPDHVHAHRPYGARKNRVHTGDSRAVNDVGRAGKRVRELAGVEHVAFDEREVRVVCERRAAERVAVEVVDGDDLVVVDEPPRERRPDESRAAGDDDALSAQSHAGESRRARSLP